MSRGLHVSWLVLSVAAACAAPRPTAAPRARRPADPAPAAPDENDEVPPVADRVRRRIPDGVFPPLASACHEPAARFCRDGCASLSDFERTFDCHQVELQRCGSFRALTVTRPLAGFIALFDNDGHFVAGERWSDGSDECNGTARTAYFGPSVRCTATDEFVPWCAPR